MHLSFDNCMTASILFLFFLFWLIPCLFCLSLLSTIFISFIIIGVLSITSVLPVALSIRDMYYRHKAAGMLNSRSVGRALARAEWRFIVISSLLFCVVFIPISGIANSSSHTLRQKVRESFAFWGFFTFNVAIYSYIGMLTGVLLCYSMHSISSLTAIFTCFAVTLYRPAFHVFGQGTRYSSNFG